MTWHAHSYSAYFNPEFSACQMGAFILHLFLCRSFHRKQNKTKQQLNVIRDNGVFKIIHMFEIQP